MAAGHGGKSMDFEIMKAWGRILVLSLTMWPWISCLSSPHLYNDDIILVIELLREIEVMPKKQLANCLACSGLLGIGSNDVIMQPHCIGFKSKNPKSLSFHLDKASAARYFMSSVQCQLKSSFKNVLLLSSPLPFVVLTV